MKVDDNVTIDKDEAKKCKTIKFKRTCGNL
uniref:Uncharacterized protein n=1 Tax=CrAss-like virus sp. ctYsL76 TaxID=2826826 RepID=A0A8S5QLX2_9CAUD|nr:MAG TPA: hypothetical protein [CrAss-like virus sp. ctYsL76]